jgi:hypothetical protein
MNKNKIVSLILSTTIAISCILIKPIDASAMEQDLSLTGVQTVNSIGIQEKSTVESIQASKIVVTQEKGKVIVSTKNSACILGKSIVLIRNKTTNTISYIDQGTGDKEGNISFITTLDDGIYSGYISVNGTVIPIDEFIVSNNKVELPTITLSQENKKVLVSIKDINSIGCRAIIAINNKISNTIAYIDQGEIDKDGNLYFSTQLDDGTYDGYVSIDGDVVKINEFIVKNSSVIVVPTIVSVKPLNSISIYKGETVNLPSTVIAVYSDGSQKSVSVKWPNVDTSVAGSFTVKGEVDGFTTGIEIVIDVLEKEIVKPTIIRIEPLDSIYVKRGKIPSLPSMVTAVYSDGSKKTLPIKWDNVDTSTKGSKTVYGTVDGFNDKVSITVYVKSSSSNGGSSSNVTTNPTVPTNPTTPVDDSKNNNQDSKEETNIDKRTQEQIITDARTLVDNAIKSSSYYIFNIAYGDVMKIQDLMIRDELLCKLNPIADKIFTKDILYFTDLIVRLANTGSAKIYDKLEIELRRNTSLQELDREYLLGEVTSWGKKLVFTKDYSDALDKVLKAWDSSKGTDYEKNQAIKVANEAIAKVQNNYSKEYLQEEIRKIEKQSKN